MSDAASLASCLMAGLSAGLATLAFGPAALIWRRCRRRFALTAPLLAAILLAGSYAGLSGSLSDSLLFALACGAGAAAASLDLTVRRVHDVNSLIIAATGLAAASLDGSWLSAIPAAIGSVAILGLAGALTSAAKAGATLGLGDILFAAACGLWIEPGHLPSALLAAVAATLVLARPWRSSSPTRIAFVPGLGLGYGAAALFAGLA